MPFLADIRHWKTVSDFEAHLAQYDPAICAWVKGLTYHHTYIPTVAQWAGRRSMDGLVRFYRDDKGWSTGPHLFIGPDGIWQLCPLNAEGIHAVSFNDTHWGLEIVGDYDKIAWQEPIRSLALGAGAALLRWRGLPVSAVNGHRDDPRTTKSCPGRAINLDQVRAELQEVLRVATPPTAPAGLTFQAAPRMSAAQFARALQAAKSPAAPFAGELYAIPIQYGIDPAVALAFFKHESSCGTAGITPKYDTKNWGNVRTPVNPQRGQQLTIPGRGQFFKFNSWQNGLADWCERINERYITQRGLSTVEQAIPVYAPSSDGNNERRYIQAVREAVASWQAASR